MPGVLQFISHVTFAFVNWELQNAYRRTQNYVHSLPRYKYNPTEEYSNEVLYGAASITEIALFSAVWE